MKVKSRDAPEPRVVHAEKSRDHLREFSRLLNIRQTGESRGVTSAIPPVWKECYEGTVQAGAGDVRNKPEVAH